MKQEKEIDPSRDGVRRDGADTVASRADVKIPTGVPGDKRRGPTRAQADQAKGGRGER